MRENYINHVALVLDRSLSMRIHERSLIKVADELVRHLAERSQQLDQETRVTVYGFNDDVTCLIYDKDVLRLPSIATLYRVGGNTALIDAVVVSQDDLALTAQKYGEHAFLTYVLTDGQENRSRFHTPGDLNRLIGKQPDNWTIAAMVPDRMGEDYARNVGFYPGNIAMWDARTQAGLEAAMTTVRTATDNFMQSRTTGLRGTRTLFSTGAEAVNKETIKAANLKSLSRAAYVEMNVPAICEIRPFVEGQGRRYVIGSAFYQLTKREKIQANKAIAIRRKKDGTVYTGTAARDLLGLPNVEVSVSPDFNREYVVFVQSTSVNRKLVPGTRLLVML